MKFIAALLVLLSISFSASANLTSQPSSFGADTIVHDVQTNLNWLDLSLTEGYSYVYVNEQLAIGGKFYGYRFATVQEVTTLFQHAGISAIGSTGQFGVEQYNAANNLLNMLNANGTADPLNLCSSCNNTYTFAFTAEAAPNPHLVDSNGVIGVGRVYSYLGVTYDPRLITMLGYPSEYFGYANPLYDVMTLYADPQYISGAIHINSWLVSAVPEPKSQGMLFLGLGFIGLVQIRKGINK